MKMKLFSRILVSAAFLACAVAAQAQQVFRITAIPDESPTEGEGLAAPPAP